MTVGDLVRYGLSERVVSLWQERQGDMLLAIQQRAVSQGLLAGSASGSGGTGENLLILAPTSSGKSFCAEMAAMRALGLRCKVVYLLPLKVLAEQTARQFRSLYGEMGLRSIVLSADHPRSSVRFARGDYDVAFAIYEKLDVALTANLDLLANVGLVVVDELQSITEAGRGAVLERLLTRVKRSVYNPRLIGLSAVLRSHQPGVAQLADWLGARIVEERSRPVDLKIGVACRGRWRYCLYNSGLQCEEEFPVDEDLFGSLVAYAGNCEERILVFVKSRRDAMQGALGLASQVDLGAAKGAIRHLKRLEASHVNRSLIQALGRGVAFHNSDMTARQRAIVERAYRRGDVRLLVATTTLAMGVNLGADTVFLETVKYHVGEYRERPGLVPISRFAFENMVGRAGRCGGDGGGREGRGIVLAANEFEQDVLCRAYVDGTEEVAVTSSLAEMSAADWCLSLVVSGAACDVEGLTASYRDTWWARLEPDHEVGRMVSGAVEWLERSGMIERSGDGRLSGTQTGRLVACRGLSCGQGEHVMRVLDDGVPTGPTGWLALALGTPGMELPPGLLSRAEHEQHAPVRQAYERWGELPQDVDRLMFPAGRQGPIEYAQASRLKALMLLEDWCAMEPATVLEERWQVHLGQVMSLAGGVSHVVAAAGVMASEVGCLDDESRRETEDLVFSLRSGLVSQARSLALLTEHGLDRHDVAALYRSGVQTVGEVIETDDQSLMRLLGSAVKVRICNKIKERYEQEVDMESMATRRVVTSDMQSMMSRLESLEVDGTYQDDRYLVRINGFPVRLTGKSFKYLVKLAWSRLHRDSGWVYKEEIETGFNQARYLYRMKQEITGSVPVGGGLVQNNRLGYYRLNVEPGRIRINHERLREHEDYEIRQLMAQAQQAN